MNGRMKNSKKVASMMAICIFLVPTLLGGAIVADNNDDKINCSILFIGSDIKPIERTLPEKEVVTLEKQLDILSKIYQVLKNPKKGCLEKIWSRFMGERIFNVLKEKKILPQGCKNRDMFPSLSFHREKRWGILTSVMSYGSGKVYIPFKLGERGSIRPIFRPIFWHYPIKGVTSVRLGATYSWPGEKTLGYRGWLSGPQSGVMMGFTGIHIKLSHKLRPDTHFLLGKTLSIKGYQRALLI
jgi:hypothetical protein